MIKRKKIWVVLLIISIVFSINANSQLLIADYPLSTNSNDLTGNFAPIIYGLNATPPPSSACANGTYSSDTESINNGFGTFSTPPLDALFNQSNFEIDFDFKTNIIPVSASDPMPVLTLGPSYRTIGVCISQSGAVGIMYNNSQYIFSTTIITASQLYSVSLQYLAPSYKLFLNNTVILSGTLPALNFAPPVFNDIKLYAANGSNGQAFNGCISKLKVYSCSLITATIAVTASENKICKGTPVSFTATVQNEGTAPLYQWKLNGTNVGINSATFTTTVLNDKDEVTCTLTSNAPCVPSSVVTSNPIIVSVNSKPIVNRDTFICANSSLQLMAASALDYQWSPSQGLSNVSIQNPVFSAVNPNSSYTYFLTTTNYSGNLVQNPDFEQGNTGFFTNYTYCNTGNCLFPLADNGYSVGTNANFFHSIFQGKDHTTGTGNFMIINGARPNLVVWRQTIAVTPNTDYAFGTWISTVVASNTASIKFSINGKQLGNIFSAPSVINQWLRYFTTWNSSNDSLATIEIVNIYPQANGNDFGLDDIFFAKITSCTDSIKP